MAHCFLPSLVSVRKPAIEIIGFLSRRRLHLERSPSGTRHCSQPENADFLSEMFPDRHSERECQGSPSSTPVRNMPQGLTGPNTTCTKADSFRAFPTDGR